MSSNQNEHMVKVIVDFAIFLEFTNSRLLDEDSAVRAMEQLASELQLINANARHTLSTKIAVLAHSYSAIREFVAELPKKLGLIG